MNAETLEALRGSIAKWEGIVAGTVEDRGIKNCPLCQLYWNDECRGCPVMQNTSLAFCRDTPYEDFCELYYNIDVERGDPRIRQAAQEELDFLKSLLPEDKQ